MKSLEAALGGEEAAAAKATSSAPTTVEAGRAAAVASTRTDGGNMDVDTAAPVRGAGTEKSRIQGDVMRRAIRELPLLDGHLLELRRTVRGWGESHQEHGLWDAWSRLAGRWVGLRVF